MHAFSSALLLGAVAVQYVLGRPEDVRARRESAILKRSVDSFIEKQTPVSWQRLLCNIGSTGCAASGAAPGVVVASPSKKDPDYWYTWTRDSALVFKGIVDAFVEKYDPALQTQIQNYVISQAKLQAVSNPSGGLSDGRGLGEAKYMVDLTQFTGAWGRPQRDGPPLRAIALMGYAKWLLDNGYTSTAQTVVWPVIKNDLSYSAQYWNQTGFDLWEEVQGSSFFTIVATHRALVEGAAMARSLGTSCSACSSVAPQVLCFAQRFWNSNQNYVVSNINGGNNRNGRDANSILASIHNFDPSAGCESLTFQPCSDRALANHKSVVDSFRSIYTINNGIPSNQAVAIGRYSEDVYYNGNPWYLTTLSAAEQLYAALHTWTTQSSLTITPLSLPFFQSLLPSATTGTYIPSSPQFTPLLNAVRTYADGFLSIVESRAHPNGSLPEQFDRNSGRPIAAADLTWSYSAFLTGAARRAGRVPPTWGAASALGTQLPAGGQCSGYAVAGTYARATNTAFPPSQTPGTPGPQPTGIPEPTEPQPCTDVLVTFEARVATVWGESVKLVGSVPALGGWKPEAGVSLDAGGYTAGNPVWKTAVVLAAGERVEYKYVVVGADGKVRWEGGGNRGFTVEGGAGGCESARGDSWQ